MGTRTKVLALPAPRVRLAPCAKRRGRLVRALGILEDVPLADSNGENLRLMCLACLRGWIDLEDDLPAKP